MIQGKWYPMGSDISLPLSLRRIIFNTETDETDASSWQVIVSDGEKPVGCGRLWWQDGAFHIGNIGVLPEERNRGFGDLLIRLLLFKSLTHNAHVIKLETNNDTVNFFKKYGFTVAGECNGITAMSIKGEDVQLSHCGGNCSECSHMSQECAPKALR